MISLIQCHSDSFRESRRIWHEHELVNELMGGTPSEETGTRCAGTRQREATHAKTSRVEQKH